LSLPIVSGSTSEQVQSVGALYNRRCYLPR
jgi:hypothetical protein